MSPASAASGNCGARRDLHGLAGASTPAYFTVWNRGGGTLQARRHSSDSGLVAIGLAIGVTGALVLARYIQGLLFAVEPHDPATITGVAVTMAAIGMAACWVPAARAARIAPSEALRAP